MSEKWISHLSELDKWATPGVWGQFNPFNGPWQELAQQNRKHLDSSHNMSALIGGKPKRIAEFTHANDAAFAETLVNAYRDGELVPAGLEQELVEALKELHLQALQSTVNDPSNDWGREAIEKATYLIAKAEGQS